MREAAVAGNPFVTYADANLPLYQWLAGNIADFIEATPEPGG